MTLKMNLWNKAKEMVNIAHLIGTYQANSLLRKHKLLSSFHLENTALKKRGLHTTISQLRREVNSEVVLKEPYPQCLNSKTNKKRRLNL